MSEHRTIIFGRDPDLKTIHIAIESPVPRDTEEYIAERLSVERFRLPTMREIVLGDVALSDSAHFGPHPHSLFVIPEVSSHFHHRADIARATQAILREEGYVVSHLVPRHVSEKEGLGLLSLDTSKYLEARGLELVS